MMSDKTVKLKRLTGVSYQIALAYITRPTLLSKNCLCQVHIQHELLQKVISMSSGKRHDG